MDRIPRHTAIRDLPPPHNLGLYRLRGFCARRRGLHRLQSWLLESEAQPVLGLVGPEGLGKSALATAAAWSVSRYFPDGIVWAASAGLERFRFYDVVRNLDTVLGSAITGRPHDMWQAGILELLYRKRRLLILDETETAAAAEWAHLLSTFSSLQAGDTASRILIVSDSPHPVLQELAGTRVLTLRGFTLRATETFLAQYSPGTAVSPAASGAATARVRMMGGISVDATQAHRLTRGSPLGLRLLLGHLAYAQEGPDTLAAVIEERPVSPLAALGHHVLQRCQAEHPDAHALLVRLTTAAGGASYAAVRDLFWQGAGTDMAGRTGPLRFPHWEELPAALQGLLQYLMQQALLEHDPGHGRVVVHPAVRRMIATGTTVHSEGWLAAHARFYVRFAIQYERVDLAHWSDVDPEWGNVRQGADWCVQFMRRGCGQDPLVLAAALAEKRETLPALAAAPEDLGLVSRYARAMALHAFWRHPPRSLDWIAAGAVACVALADFRGFGLLLLHLGRQLYFRRDYQQSLFWLEQARATFARCNVMIQLAYVHTDMGMVHRELGQPVIALRHCQLAFHYLAPGGDLAELASAYLNLGSLFLSLRDYAESLQQYRHGLRLALRLDDRRLMANAYNNLGLVLEARSQFAEAQAVYHRALELYQYMKLVEGESTALNNLGSAAFLEGDAARAEMRYRQALACCAGRGAWLDMAATHHNLGLVLQKQARWADAAREFAAGLAFYRTFRLDAYAAEEEILLAQCRTRLAET